MNLPYLTPGAVSSGTVNAFYGLHKGDAVPEDRFFDTRSITADAFPAAAVRARRARAGTIAEPNGLFAKGCLYWCDGTGFYGADGENGETVLRGSVSDSPKTFASMGAFLLIWPDKKYYNVKTKLFGDLEKRFEAPSDVLVGYTPARWDPSTQATQAFTEAITVSNSAPPEPEDGAWWLDTSVLPNALKRWSKAASAWVPAPTTYVKISAPGIGVGFSRYDGVKISGSENEAFNQTFVLYDAAEDYITVTGLVREAFTQAGGLSVSRETPDMDFIAEQDNRLWGCSSENREIYACKLGDPFNWNCFENLSTDSYAATVGSDGDFTGAASHGGYVLFFKEERVHKLYGSKPANYQITESELPGVAKGSEKSLVSVGTTLYYHAREGVMAYGGGFPENISEPLGPGSGRFTDAAAGARGRKLYISVKAADTGEFGLFTYDTARNIWCREDETRAAAFANAGGTLYFMTDAGDVFAADGDGAAPVGDGAALVPEGAPEWMLETGDFGSAEPDSRYISKLQLKFEMSETSKVSVFVQYDSSGAWERIGAPVTAPRKRLCAFPILPRRCRHMRVRLAGSGDFRLFSLTKTTARGSEL